MPNFVRSDSGTHVWVVWVHFRVSRFVPLADSDGIFIIAVVGSFEFDLRDVAELNSVYQLGDDGAGADRVRIMNPMS